MYSGKLVLSQLLDALPMHHFRSCVKRMVTIRLNHSRVALLLRLF